VVRARPKDRGAAGKHPLKLPELVERAAKKESFQCLDDYVSFARRYLDFIDRTGSVQARIVSQNENHYQFLQYKQDGHYNITRPLNSKVFISAADSGLLAAEFQQVIREPWKIDREDEPSSKDRLDKVFIDKWLYCKLTETCIPHIAIFLNDVQRKNTREENRYGISATFLPGHFKGYTIKLNPLDGVYYCDLRPNMRTDPFLSKHIRTIDHFFCGDLGRFVALPGDAAAEIRHQKRLP
jgi:hypothetical protein